MPYTKRPKTCEAVITNSLSYTGAISLRSKKKNDIRGILKEVGFEKGDKVIIITKEEYDMLVYKSDRFDIDNMDNL